tara:strand:- start:714 stop:1328 length:615 start_codon:yes stop_codon:yes gene_type:complete
MHMNRLSETYLIGLTGNICTGKTIVCGILSELGAEIIDADVVTHEVLQEDDQAILDIGNVFGKDIVDKNGNIDRKQLGKIVFNDSVLLKKLEELLHPLIRLRIENLISTTNKDVVVVEAIKLLESGLSDKCNSIWVVNASEKVRLQRLMERDNISSFEAKKMLYFQMSQDYKLNNADVVINNNNSFEDTYVQVRCEWGKIVLSK